MIAAIPQSPATIELPDELHLQIGRLITIFSAVERSAFIRRAAMLIETMNASRG